MTHRDPVRLWHVRLDEPASSECLSDDERARAARFKSDVDRTRFVNCRSRLRTVLAELTGTAPQHIRFEYTARGKPFLPNSHLRFNVSHSGADALIALTQGREIGVDLEQRDLRIDPDSLARQFLTPRESAFVMSGEDRLAAFLACWTRKEAWAKALGVGIVEELGRFDMADSLGLPMQVLRDPVGGGMWTILELSVPPGVHAALAVEGVGVEIQKYS